MHIEEILQNFNHLHGRFPTEAVNAALEQQEAFTPYLLSILEHTIANYERIDIHAMDYIFALYILSKFREKKALPYILALASLPGDWPENLLGDCITEGLASFIVSTFSDDLLPIKKLVEDTTLNEWSRCAALRSLLGLVALDKIQREELIDYLRTLFHSSLADDKTFVANLVNIATDLYPEELIAEINQVCEEDKIDIFAINKKWIERILSQGKERCLADHVYHNRFHLPIDDVEEAMCWMQVFHSCQKKDLSSQGIEYADWDAYNHLDSEIVTTYVREIPKIGRNDPCPCGSGKKFKKCCL